MARRRYFRCGAARMDAVRVTHPDRVHEEIPYFEVRFLISNRNPDDAR
jgi:hypothetical protein